MKEIYKTLLSMIHTIYDRDALIHELNVLDEHLFQASQSTREAIRTYVSARYAAELIHITTELGIGQTENGRLKSVVDEIIDQLSHMKELDLRVAFDPNEEDIQALSQWIRFHVGVNAILNVTYDPTVTGGAIITYGGAYRDYSLATRIDEQLARAV
jgi:hypothetical protein